MQAVALVPSARRDILWLDNDLMINLGSFDDANLNEARELPIGTLASPPVAVAAGSNELHVFGVATQRYALYHWRYDAAAPFGTRWSQAEVLGLNFTSTPAAVVAGTNRIDVFCLGPDQGMLHTRWDGSRWTDWGELGGCFTSLPVVLADASGSCDVFARGIDNRIYHASWSAGSVPIWRKVGGDLLGEPSAASAPAAVKLGANIMLFTTATDGAIWYSAFDGVVWKPWLSLGPARTATADHDAITFASEPVPIALISHSPVNVGVGSATTGGGGAAVAAQPRPIVTGATRVDVFGVGSDNGLWQKTLHASGWQPGGSWVSLGGSFACAPSVVAPTHGISVMSTPPARFALAAPQTDGRIQRWTFHPEPTPAFPTGGWTTDDAVDRPSFRLPTRFTFAVDNVQIDDTRSQHEDTDLGVVTLRVGNWPLQTMSFDMGDLNNGSHTLSERLTLTGLVELCEPAIFSYSVVNNHDSGDDKTVVSWVVKGLEDYINDQLKDKENLKKLGGAIGGTVGGVVAGPVGAIAGSIIGTGVLPWFTDNVISFAFGGCDGLVAAEAIAYQTGRDVHYQVAAHGSGSPRHFSTSSRNLRSDYPSGCRASSYLIFTSITQL